jgi:surface protein
LNSSCVFYDGDDLNPLSVTNGDNLTDVIIAINNYLSTTGSGLYTNVGTGAQMFKQVNVFSQAEFRTLVSSDNSLTFTQNDDEIDVVLTAPTPPLDVLLESVGGGEIDIYQGWNPVSERHEIKSLFEATVGEEFIYVNPSNPDALTQRGLTSPDIEITTTDDEIIIDTSTIAENIGGADDLYKGYNPTTNKHEFRTVRTDNTGIPVGEINPLDDVLDIRSITSTGGTVSVTKVGETINLETSGGGGAPDPNQGSTLAWAFNATFDYNTISPGDTLNLISANFYNLGVWTCVQKDVGNTFIDFESNDLGFALPSNLELGLNASLPIVASDIINITRLTTLDPNKIAIRVYKANGGSLTGITGIKIDVVARGFGDGGVVPPPDTAFISTWRTTSPLEQIELPYVSYGNYTGTINWGDGSVSPNNFANRFHTYANPGTYTVTIEGDIEGFTFGRNVVDPIISLTNKVRFMSVEQWGTLKIQVLIAPIGDFQDYFADCSNMTIPATDSLDLTNLVSLQGMFASCLSLTTIPGASGWNTSAIQNFNGMFQNAIQFNESGINSWNVAAATTMNSMFRDCVAFDVDLSNWSPSFVGDMNNFMTGKDSTNYSAANYDAFLIKLDSIPIQSNVTLDMGGIKYTAAGAVARADIIANNNWNINDGGLV